MQGSLVLYKNRPARVKSAEDKLVIEMAGGEVVKVRPKDVALLHPGPLRSLGELRLEEARTVVDPDILTAWEMLAGSTTTLPELAELAYGAYTPATAWALWQLVAEGLYFRGDPEEIIVCTPAEVAHKQATRTIEAAEKQAWNAFLERIRAPHARLAPEDDRYLRGVEALALGQSTRSRVLRELGREESPENAHALLLELGRWDATVNPYPRRLQVPTALPELVLSELPAEARLDLTHLPACAIDDENTETPDDALSLVDGRLWVHVADGGALVAPGSPADEEACARGETLHLPEKIVHMLPQDAIRRLGLGLAEISPALSFGLALDAAGEITGMEVIPSWVRVERLTYEEAEARLDEEPLSGLHHLAQVHLARRRDHGAILIEMPEVRVRVAQGEITVRPVLPLRSRALVEEAMIMAGEAVARFASERGIPVPFATQEPADTQERPETLSGMYALRRTLKRSQHRSLPAPHAGLGLAAYVQATSPLRRYLDLVVHQQLRAYLSGGRLLDSSDILERIGAVEAVTGSVRRAEALSEQHWTLAYLLRHPRWRGEGILVEKRGLVGTVVIPELGLEPRVHLAADLPLDSRLPLVLRAVALARLEADFRVE